MHKTRRFLIVKRVICAVSAAVVKVVELMCLLIQDPIFRDALRRILDLVTLRALDQAG